MAIARLGSRATAEANRIWGGVYIEKGGVHVIVPYFFNALLQPESGNRLTHLPY